jgi:valyl-tRNA synthetase
MLTDIYFRYEERLAGSNLVGKMVVDINNINTLSTELKSFRDITTATGFVVKDGQFSNIANKFHYLEQGTNAQVQDLINVHKSLKNDFYNRAGRITSNEKYQTNTTEVGVELLDSGIIYQRKYYIVKNFIEELNKNGGDFYFDKGLEEQKLETVVGSNRDSSANNEEESKKGEENV